MKLLIGLLLPCFFLTCCNNGKKSSSGQDSGNIIVASATSDTAKSESESKKDPVQQFMSPGEEHKMIASWNGSWIGEITFYQDKQEIKGTSVVTNKMIMGGRYQVSNQKGAMGKNNFEGMNTLGFDNQKKLFVSTWVDNMGTGIITLRGPWNETTKTINLTGTETDPVSGNDKTVHETVRIIDNNRQIIEIFEPSSDGKETKIMQTLLTRKTR